MFVTRNPASDFGKMTCFLCSGCFRPRKPPRVWTVFVAERMRGAPSDADPRDRPEGSPPGAVLVPPAPRAALLFALLHGFECFVMRCVEAVHVLAPQPPLRRFDTLQPEGQVILRRLKPSLEHLERDAARVREVIAPAKKPILRRLAGLHALLRDEHERLELVEERGHDRVQLPVVPGARPRPQHRLTRDVHIALAPERVAVLLRRPQHICRQERPRPVPHHDRPSVQLVMLRCDVEVLVQVLERGDQLAVLLYQVFHENADLFAFEADRVQLPLFVHREQLAQLQVLPHPRVARIAMRARLALAIQVAREGTLEHQGEAALRGPHARMDDAQPEAPHGDGASHVLPLPGRFGQLPSEVLHHHRHADQPVGVRFGRERAMLGVPVHVGHERRVVVAQVLDVVVAVWLPYLGAPVVFPPAFKDRLRFLAQALEKVLLAFPFWLARGGLQIRVQRVIVDPCQVGEQPVHGGGEVGAAGRDRLGDVGKALPLPDHGDPVE
eukprot:scaffold98159_cov63-Phaeocystis_antarctica.AAC.1